jgi:putative membrane protein
MMWGWGWGGLGHGLWWAGGVMMVVVWAVIITGGVLLIRYLARQGSRRGRDGEPLEILKTRYARGEISREQFDAMRRDLT